MGRGCSGTFAPVVIMAVLHRNVGVAMWVAVVRIVPTFTIIAFLKISEILYVLLGFCVNFSSGDWLVLVYLRMVMVMVVY